MFMFNMNNWCVDVFLMVKLIYFYFFVCFFLVGGRLLESEVGFLFYYLCFDNICIYIEKKCFNVG